jgi:broad specificity phosphatase PhoE
MRPVARLVLCRHGNTFQADETPYMVGSREDISLTEEGERQAHAIGAALKRAGYLPDQIISGPLKRTARFAEIIAAELGGQLAIKVDERLAELDYGSWSGKTNKEIESSESAPEFVRWNERDEWPPSPGFHPSEQEVQHQLNDFLEEIAKRCGSSIAVSSNGRFRILSRIMNRSASGKVGTGRACVLDFNGTSWHVVAWNVSADQIIPSLLKATQKA